MIKQAIIPLAGLGTRLLPLTSVFAKELLPINGKPGIEYIIDECIEAGIKEIIFIISKKKIMIKNIIKKCGDCGKSIVDTEKYDKIAKKYSESIKKSENEKNHLKKTLEDQLKNQKQKQALAINEALKNEKKDREAEITKQVKIKTEKENKRTDERAKRRNNKKC